VITSVRGVKQLELVSTLMTLNLVLHRNFSPIVIHVIVPLFMVVPIACMEVEDRVEIVSGVQTEFVTFLVGWLLSLTVVLHFVVKMEEIVQLVPLLKDVLGANLRKCV